MGEAKKAMLDWEEGKFPVVAKYKKISGTPDDGDIENTPVM
jgi:hypothetical protein